MSLHTFSCFLSHSITKGVHVSSSCLHPPPQSMYSALSGLLDGNPFSESGQLRVPDGLENILEVLKEALKLLTAFQVHPDIALQLCAYLFFFINASLFNTLMERGKICYFSFNVHNIVLTVSFFLVCLLIVFSYFVLFCSFMLLFL